MQRSVDREVGARGCKEFYDHRRLSAATNVKVYFTHPYSSTERGSIENLNGLVRYYLPKRTSFAKLTQRRLNELEKLLNHRPRKCLDYLTPHEVHSKNATTPPGTALHLIVEPALDGAA